MVVVVFGVVVVCVRAFVLFFGGGSPHPISQQAINDIYGERAFPYVFGFIICFYGIAFLVLMK